MKMTGRALYDAVVTLAAIINRPRNLPQTAKYRLARMHQRLLPDYTLLEDERVKLIRELGEPVYLDEAKTQPTEQWRIPDENTAAMTEYRMRWNTLLNEEIDVNVLPIPLAALGNETNGIEADEFVRLGDLVSEE